MVSSERWAFQLALVSVWHDLSQRTQSRLFKTDISFSMKSLASVETVERDFFSQVFAARNKKTMASTRLKGK